MFLYRKENKVSDLNSAMFFQSIQHAPLVCDSYQSVIIMYKRLPGHRKAPLFLPGFLHQSLFSERRGMDDLRFPRRFGPFFDLLRPSRRSNKRKMPSQTCGDQVLEVFNFLSRDVQEYIKESWSKKGCERSDCEIPRIDGKEGGGGKKQRLLTCRLRRR